MILTLKGKLKRGKVLSIRPTLVVKVFNWEEVRHLCGKIGYFNVIPYYTKKKLCGIEIIKYVLIDGK